ncbi:MAG: aconitate hydratase, partial [Kiritimatiellae bacterium]|nr:aconitate hydratase [Kiritimatiellia bacterium]
VDHNTVQVGFENADDHDYLQSVAKKYGVIFSKPGNGICHQLHLERFGKPGKTLIGSDSHTPTGGGLGMMAMGAGGIDVAVAMGGGAFHITYPKVIGVKLTGALPAGVSAKDVILKVLSKYGTKGNVGKVVEYFGPGVATLDVPSRATICNMGAELGVTTSAFPSDGVTHDFLAAQGREADWSPLAPDPDAEYDEVFEIDLSALEPLAAAPHSPGNVVSVASLAGTKVNQVMIGSCTNSSYRDIKTVAQMLRGKTVAPDVEVGIACGSKQVVRMLADDGSLSDLLVAGCRLLENACGFCIGAHMSPRTGAVSLRTSNRNFEARSGTKDARVYLVSPETAAAAALSGVIADPRALATEPVEPPARFTVDDSMFLYRDTAGKGIPGTEVVRGPNIGQVPAGKPLPARLDGVATIKVGDKITTDHIMPAGARLKYRSNVPAYAKYVFENVDGTFHDRASAIRDAGRFNVIVAGESYGQGSSREHAAMCPMYLGVKMVIAKGIERIHKANLVNFGILPCLFADAADYDRVQAGDDLEVADLRAALTGDGTLVVRDKTQGFDFRVVAGLSAREREIIADGGLLAHVARG